MIRTQIYVPEVLHNRVKLLAKKQKKPFAEILREFIKQGIKDQQRTKTKSLESLTKLKITGGPKDLSKNMDKYLFQE